MNKITFDILSPPYLEAITALGLEYKVDGSAILVSRDSMVNEFPRVKEQQSYDATYNEIFSYVLAHFDWVKLDDQWFLLNIPEYGE